jgi:hypothetical protein
MKRLVIVVAAFAILATPAVAATPKQVKEAYGGLGANVSIFYTHNAHGSGNPPIGVAYYRIDSNRYGRVSVFHIVVNDKKRRTGDVLKRLVTGRELPADATQVQGWKYIRATNAYCAIYKSRWLRRVLYGPYAVLYVEPARQTASAVVSTAPACRG